MIKLQQVTRKELGHLSSFFQCCINLARTEIRKQVDVQLYVVDGKNYATNEIPWPQASSDKIAMKIAERHAHISEFEKAQEVMIKSYMRKAKSKSVTISGMAGYLLLIYMGRAEALQHDPQVNLTIQVHAQTILQKLI